MEGAFYCPRCGQKSAIWQNDFTFEDYCMEGEGLVTVYSCANCHSDIEVYTPEESEDE